MKEIIGKFCCDNSKRNGLLLVDSPTGSGKTRHALHFAYDFCMDSANVGRKVFFITPLKKNLPLDDLRKIFREHGHEAEFEEKVMFVNSNYDTLIEVLNDEIEDRIPDEIKSTAEYKALMSNLDICRLLQKNKNGHEEEQKVFAAKVREKTEPEFRHMVLRKFSKLYPNVSERYKLIKTDEKWKWIGELYPSVFIREKQIVFMSLRKFIAQIATPLEESYSLTDSSVSYLENGVVIIDEFDATKDVMLSAIVDDDQFTKIDYVELFNQIARTLKDKRFSAMLMQPSEKRMSGKYSEQSLVSIVDKLREMSEGIISDYHLDCNYKAVDTDDQISKSFIFQDYKFHIVHKDDKPFITVKFVEDENINKIVFSNSKEKSGNKESSLRSLLGSLNGFISYFKTAVTILADNYLECKSETSDEVKTEFTLEQAVRTVLSEFYISDNYLNYLTNQIIFNRPGKTRKDEDELDESVYQKGFRYFVIENDNRHDTMSKIYMYSFDNSPEKLLLKVCTATKVVGISATATIPTVISNFDLNYIKSKLGDSFIKLSAEERGRLQDLFNQSISHYGDVEIKTELLGLRDPNREYEDVMWEEVFQTKDYARFVSNKLNMRHSEYYIKERYRRIALIFLRFVQHDDIQSALCVMNMLPEYKKYGMDLNVIEEVAELICQDNGIEYKDEMIYVLSGKEFDARKINLLERLEKGEKVFVISAYQTVGAGQNLQYKIPDFKKHDVVRINDFEAREEKDFDAVYLDKPTNVLVYMKPSEISAESFAKHLFHIEYLQERGEISPNEAHKEVKKAFLKYIGVDIGKNQQGPMYNSNSFRYSVTRNLIQAVGRICRTNMKNKTIYVFGDSQIPDVIAGDIDSELILNPEFKAFLYKCKNSGCKPIEHKETENIASLQSMRASRSILSMIKYGWDEPKMEFWKAFRDFVLRHPTAALKVLDTEPRMRQFFIRMLQETSRFYYSQNDDFREIKVSFTKSKDTPYCVSEEAARLGMLFMIPGVREYFEQKEYATSFEPNEFAMSPATYHNIYLGALGEVVGRYIFENQMEVPLEEINDVACFEKFDFKITGLPVYVDFKYWKEYSDKDRAEEIEKIIQKMDQVNCKAVIIANIITESDEYVISKINRDGKTIYTIPFLYSIADEAKINLKACELMNKVVKEYADKNQ